MFDVKWIRENPEAFDRGRARRNLPPLSAEIVAGDANPRAAPTPGEEIRARRPHHNAYFRPGVGSSPRW